MDATDLALLRLIQADARRSAAELGQEVGLSVSAVNERLRRLHASGAIRAQRAILDPARVGIGLTVFMFVDLLPRADEDAFLAALQVMPEVQEAFHITGPHNWLLKLRVADTAALQAFAVKHLKALPAVLRTETMVALLAGKETTELAL